MIVMATTAAVRLQAARDEGAAMRMIELTVPTQKVRPIPTLLSLTMNTKVEANDAIEVLITRAVTMIEMNEGEMTDEETEAMTELMIEVVEVEVIGQEKTDIEDLAEGIAATDPKAVTMKMSMGRAEVKEIHRFMGMMEGDHTIVMTDTVLEVASRAVLVQGTLNPIINVVCCFPFQHKIVA